jgi:hypothetical protein
MTEPCRSDCAVPTHIARCDPSGYCPQHSVCARKASRSRQPPINGMALKNPEGAWCPIFVDVRALARSSAEAA